MKIQWDLWIKINMKRGLAHCAAVCNSLWGKTRIQTVLHSESLRLLIIIIIHLTKPYGGRVFFHWPLTVLESTWMLELLTHLAELLRVRSNANWTNWQNIEYTRTFSPPNLFQSFQHQRLHVIHFIQLGALLYFIFGRTTLLQRQQIYACIRNGGKQIIALREF